MKCQKSGSIRLFLKTNDVNYDRQLFISVFNVRLLSNYCYFQIFGNVLNARFLRIFAQHKGPAIPHAIQGTRLPSRVAFMQMNGTNHEYMLKWRTIYLVRIQLAGCQPHSSGWREKLHTVTSLCPGPIFVLSPTWTVYNVTLAMNNYCHYFLMKK